MVWTEMERWPRHKAVTVPRLKSCDTWGTAGEAGLVSQCCFHSLPAGSHTEQRFCSLSPQTSGARGVSPAHLCSVQVWGEETSQRGAVRKHAKGCSSSAQDTQTLPALDTQGTNSVPSPEDRQGKPPGIPSTPHISGKYSLLAQDVETIPLKRPLAFFNQLTLLPRKLQ